MKKINLIIIVNLGYILGILVGLYLYKSIALFFSGLILIYFILRILKKTRRYTKLIFPTISFLVFLITALVSTFVTMNKVRDFENYFNNNKKMELTAIVRSYPEKSDNSNKYTIEVEHRKLILYTSTNIKLKYGDIVSVDGVFKNVQTFKNPGILNYDNSLRKDNIYGTIVPRSVHKIGSKKDIRAIFAQLNHKIKEKIRENLDIQTSSILIALGLGDRRWIVDDVREKIQENGLAHILAISGMHIGIICVIDNHLLDLILDDNRKKKILICIFIIFFGLIIGFIASAVRAIIMVVVAIIAKLLYRKNAPIISISIASLIILICNPYYLIDSGFILSFGATLGILYVFPKINKIKFKNSILKYVVESIILSLSVFISLFPVIILFFKKISFTVLFTGVLLNLLVIIIEIFFIVVILSPKFIIKFLSPSIRIFVKLFIEISQISVGKMYLKVPSWLEIALYYACLVLILNRKSKRKKCIKNVCCILLITIILVSMLSFLNRDMYIYFVDVGQGDCTLIKTPNNQTILIDGGGLEDYDIGKNVLIPYLFNKKINRPDYLIISHFDTDHVDRIAYYNG